MLHKDLFSDKKPRFFADQGISFDFFSLNCYKKKAETFSLVNVAKLQTRACKDTRSDKVEKAFGLQTNEVLL